MQTRFLTYGIVMVLASLGMNHANAQQALKIGTNPTRVNSSAVLDVEAAKKGALLPRVALTSATDAVTIPDPVNALTVFNTATAGVAPNNVYPGYYYWNTSTSKWVRLLTSSETVGDLRVVGTSNHLSQDAGVGSNGTSAGTGDNNIAIGLDALKSNTIGRQNLALSYGALSLNTSGSYNVATGMSSLQYNTTGSYNVASGISALNSNTTGWYNVGVGYNALASNSTGNNNVGLGVAALTSNTTGSANIALGPGAGTSGTLPANSITTGSGNFVVGKDVLVPDGTASNQMNIKNAIFGTGLTGTLAAPAGFIGINVSAPSNTLHVKASTDPLRLEGLQTGASADQAVVIDANGVLKKVAAVTPGWGLTGNAGTNTTTNFIGTTDVQNLVLKAANNSLLTLGSNSKIGVGLTPDNYSAHQLQSNYKIRFGTPLDGSNQVFSIAQAPSASSSSSSQKPFSLIVGNSFLDRSDVFIGGGLWDGTESAVQNVKFYTSATKDTPIGTERMVLDRNGNLGIGTSTPNVKLEVASGTAGISGVRLTNLTSSATTATTNAAALGVNANGDVVVMSTAASAAAKNIINMPSVAINVSTPGTFTLNLYNEYKNQYNTPMASSTGAPAAIPVVAAATDFYYYVTYFDNTIFTSVSISASGVLSYTVTGAAATTATYMNIVLVPKN